MSIEGQAERRLSALGLPTEVTAAIVRDIKVWRENMGDEVTCSRLKTLKVSFARYLAGLEPIQSDLSWIAFHKDRTPKGSFRYLWRMPRKHWQIAWNALMAYSGLIHHSKSLRCTERQFRKFVAGVQRKQPSAGSLVRAKSLIDKGRRTAHFQECDSLVPRALLHTVPRAGRVTPLSSERRTQEQGILDSVVPLAFNKRWWLRHRELFAPVLSGLEQGFEELLRMLSPMHSQLDPSRGPLVGEVLWLQEPGYKLRYVANPAMVYQVVLEPLKVYLFKQLSGLFEDATYDQGHGVERASAALREGRTVYSIDLSSATDNFPLELSVYLLRRMGIPEAWVRLYEEICRGEWQVQRPCPDVPGEDPNTVRWLVGQPLGLGPTFAAFSLSMHMIIRGLCVDLGIVGRELPYAELGDDVVIWDDRLAQAFLKVLKDLDVPTSPEKTLVSSLACEFAGKLILPDQTLVGYKWKGVTDDAFIDVARNLGPKSLSLFTKRQMMVLAVIGPVPEPYGLGWNPDGLPYSRRIGMWDRIRSPKIEPTPGTHAQNINRLLRNSYMWKKLDPNDIAHLVSDQDAEQAIQDSVPILTGMGIIGIPNVRAVSRITGKPWQNGDTPLTYPVEVSAHVTTLLRTEQEIKREFLAWSRKYPGLRTRFRNDRIRRLQALERRVQSSLSKH